MTGSVRAEQRGESLEELVLPAGVKNLLTVHSGGVGVPVITPRAGASAPTDASARDTHGGASPHAAGVHGGGFQPTGEVGRPLAA